MRGNARSAWLPILSSKVHASNGLYRSSGRLVPVAAGGQALLASACQGLAADRALAGPEEA